MTLEYVLRQNGLEPGEHKVPVQISIDNAPDFTCALSSPEIMVTISSFNAFFMSFFPPYQLIMQAELHLFIIISQRQATVIMGKLLSEVKIKRPH